MVSRVRLRGQVWLIRERATLGDRIRFKLEDPESREIIEALCPPDDYELLPEASTSFDRRALAPYGIWNSHHQALIKATPRGSYAAFHAGRISPEPYQFAPLAKLLASPRRSLLIADDVGLGKTIEAGICLLELIARGAAKRILLVVPPGLILQWIDEMWEKFGFAFQQIENSASLDRAQTAVSEGLQPWAYYDRVITSVEYLKRRDVHAAALAHPWDVIVVDEAHYLAESGTPANPYSTARTRLGPKLREAARSLILLTATPHNGYRHSFRSLLELVEPADATLHGETAAIQRRVARSMIRRLKSQIVKTGPNGSTVPAFPLRRPVQRIEVTGLSEEERQVFALVTEYCIGATRAAEGSDDADLVSFAMQIVRKRMLSSRAALQKTVQNRLEALTSRNAEEPPTRSELREMQADLPLAEAAAERMTSRILRAAVARDTQRRNAEKRQLNGIARLLEKVAQHPDPKIAALIADLNRDVVPIQGEKVIVFTEYRDTLAALRDSLLAHPELSEAFVELTGGLSSTQRKSRIARFHEPGCRILIATDAASEGLNLQYQCCRLYHLELPWNPNRLEQRNGRIDRHGQTRVPIIRYLFHPDSPEDRVLDRLVQRIGQMHDDRVSTPDILGILEGSRIEDVLGRVDSAEAADSEAQSLIRLFEAREQEFASQIAPLLMAGQSPVQQAELFGNSLSADSQEDDDQAFERVMLDQLRVGIRTADTDEVWSIDVPRHLQGTGVLSRYPRATFRRSVAVKFSSADVEFIHRLHPLFLSVHKYALEELSFAASRDAGSTRIAVRRHSLATAGAFALFTFLESSSHPKGTVFGVAVNGAGAVLDARIGSALLSGDAEPVGEVPWAECETLFAARFDDLKRAAEQGAARHVLEVSGGLEESRMRDALLLREEAALYRVDRLAEIDGEETTERQGTRQQMALFREPGVNWRARRAAVETHYRKRLEMIDTFAKLPALHPPQPLGVLLVFPPV